MSWRAELVAVWAFALRNLLMACRNVFLLFELLFWPVVNVLSIGYLTRFLELAPEATAFVLTGTLAFNVLQVCQLDVAYAVLYDAWSKSIKHQFVAPIGVRHLTVGSWLVGVLRGLAVFALQGALAAWAFDFHVLAPGPLAVAGFLAGCLLTAWTIGLFVCALIMWLGLRAETAAWASINLVLLVAGIYYPVSVLPRPMALVAGTIPLTYVLDAYRAHYGFSGAFPAPMLTGLGLAVGYVVLGHVVLVASVGWARRTGLLLKMSE